MTTKKYIRDLCLLHTDLSLEDIDFIELKAEELELSCQYSEEDVFIDILNTYSDQATVIYHKKPDSIDSLYEKDVVGDTAYLRNEPGVLRTLQTGVPTVGLSAISQEGVLIQQKVFPIFRENRVIACLIIENKSSHSNLLYFSLKKAEDGEYELADIFKESYLQQFSYLKYLSDGILVFDQKGYLLYCNQEAESIYREKLAYMDPLIGMHYDNLVLGNISLDDIIKESDNFTKPCSQSREVRYCNYHFQITRYVVPEAQVMVSHYKDVTSPKEIEKKLFLMETTLREMNHRVKNNLQTLVSLLRIQGQRSQSLEAKKICQESVDRVLSISMVHELLSTENRDNISLKELLQGVVYTVQECFSEREDICLTTDINLDISLDSSRATALAFVLNELLHNSYEHAFKKKLPKKPEIYLQLLILNGIITLHVSDNGNGYRWDDDHSNHLGLVIVERFVKSSLKGKIRVDSLSSGTRTTITFKY